MAGTSLEDSQHSLVLNMRGGGERVERILQSLREGSG